MSSGTPLPVIGSMTAGLADAASTDATLTPGRGSCGSVGMPHVGPQPTGRRLPPWLKRPLPTADMLETRKLINGLKLNTVCVEARCPNLTECWSRGTATFMVLGDECTRRCGFCAVGTKKPQPPELDEPQRMAEAAAHLGLRHVVITSVARDDLEDEGATHFANCIRAVRERLPEATIEVLVPDFHGRPELIGIVCDARPEVFNHNIETVARLQKRARPAARYERSLGVLRDAKKRAQGARAQGAGEEEGPSARESASASSLRPAPSRPAPYRILTKSGLMVGLGETWDELLQTMRDLRSADCDLLTIGQYLRPGGEQYLPVERYYPPEEFDALAAAAREMGFRAVASGPFVRSSYFAETLFAETDFLRK